MNLPDRRSIRLPDFDYTSSGWYFVTVCTARRRPILAQVAGDRLGATAAGEVVRRCWFAIPEHFDNVELDSFILMPDHVHGILILEDRSDRQRSLSDIMGAFKSAATRTIRRECGVDGTIWQRSFHERVIRSESECRKIRQYIEQNPERWLMRLS